jgi:hypothetical protein
MNGEFFKMCKITPHKSEIILIKIAGIYIYINEYRKVMTEKSFTEIKKDYYIQIIFTCCNKRMNFKSHTK